MLPPCLPELHMNLLSPALISSYSLFRPAFLHLVCCRLLLSNVAVNTVGFRFITRGRILKVTFISRRRAAAQLKRPTRLYEPIPVHYIVSSSTFTSQGQPLTPELKRPAAPDGWTPTDLEASLFFSLRDRARATAGSSLTGPMPSMAALSFCSCSPMLWSFWGFGVRSLASVLRALRRPFLPEHRRREWSETALACCCS